MTTTDTDARALVDPEMIEIAEAYPPFNVGAATLPAIREAIAQPRPGLPDPSEVYPGVVRAEHTVPGEPGEPDVRVLLYTPAEPGAPTAGLVWMHGGGYVFGTADMDELTCRRMVTETGAVVAAVDYRLAPETRAPGALHDCYAALRWLHAEAAGVGVAPARVVVGGASAGGGLAAGLAILARDRAELAVSFQLLVYPMLDDRTTVDPNPHAGQYVWMPSDNHFGWTSLLGSEPGGPDVSPYAAPARVASTDGLPPAFLAVGSIDLFAEEDIAYAARLLRSGVPVELHVYPGAFHGFELAATARTTAAHSRNLLAALRRQVTG
jgi:triacylglycerol lipase